MDPAIEQYLEIAKRFQAADQNGCKSEIDESALEKIIADIGRCVHRLEGSNAFGYAFMFKAFSLCLLYFRKLGRMELRPVNEMDEITASMRNEIQSCAERTNNILMKSESTVTNAAAMDSLMSNV